jgi:hypothetical protein
LPIRITLLTPRDAIFITLVFIAALHLAPLFIEVEHRCSPSSGCNYLERGLLGVDAATLPFAFDSIPDCQAGIFFAISDSSRCFKWASSLYFVMPEYLRFRP